MVSIAGKQVAKRTAFAINGLNTFSWNGIESFSPGIYYLYINNDDGSSAVARVVKK
jgi:hypothetical protein